MLRLRSPPPPHVAKLEPEPEVEPESSRGVVPLTTRKRRRKRPAAKDRRRIARQAKLAQPDLDQEKHEQRQPVAGVLIERNPRLNLHVLDLGPAPPPTFLKWSSLITKILAKERDTHRVWIAAKSAAARRVTERWASFERARCAQATEQRKALCQPLQEWGRRSLHRAWAGWTRAVGRHKQHKDGQGEAAAANPEPLPPPFQDRAASS